MATDTRLDALRGAVSGEVIRPSGDKRRYDPENVFRFNLNIPPA